jgi:hypothetical protein
VKPASISEIKRAFVAYWKKWEYSETVHQLSTDFRNAYNSVRRQVLYNILIEFEVPTKPVSAISRAKWRQHLNSSLNTGMTKKIRKMKCMGPEQCMGKKKN